MYNHLFHKRGLDEIHYPVAIQDIPAIEDKIRISINVFSFYDDAGRARQPIYVSK